MEQQFPFQASQLPYSHVALMPYCDADTLYYHHDKYYAETVYELNRLAVQHRLTDQSRLRSAAGSVFNHQLYFDGIGCKAGPPPFNRLTEAITAAYGSMARFQQLLTEAAESIIGSGWVWLVAEGNKGIHIATTANNEVVPLASVTPVLIADLWEHAYLSMDHFNKPTYMEDWFSLINWGRAEERYLSALGTAAVG